MKITPKFQIPAPWNLVLPWAAGILSLISAGLLCYFFNLYNLFLVFLKTIDPSSGTGIFILMMLFPLAVTLGLTLLLFGIVISFLVLRILFGFWTLITGTLFISIGLKRGSVYIENSEEEPKA
jgi:hypothetical protein